MHIHGNHTAYRGAGGVMRTTALTVACTMLALLPGVAQEQDGLGNEHAALAALTGRWTVTATQRAGESRAALGSGTADARMLLDGRFLEVVANLVDSPVRKAIYIIGFDRRHNTFNVVLLDDAGTYFVTAASDSAATLPSIAMYGTDDDPAMAAMGLEKAFAFVLDVQSPDAFSLETRFIDTRTPVRTEHSFLTLQFTRAR